MNYLQSFYPIVKKNKGDDTWVFYTSKLYKALEESNSIDESNYVVYEPFILDDISLDLSKIPVITVSKKGLKCVNIRGEDFEEIEVTCPYKPIQINEKEESEKEEKNEEEDKNEEEEDKNATNVHPKNKSSGSDSESESDSNDSKKQRQKAKDKNGKKTNTNTKKKIKSKKKSKTKKSGK